MRYASTVPFRVENRSCDSMSQVSNQQVLHLQYICIRKKALPYTTKYALYGNLKHEAHRQEYVWYRSTRELTCVSLVGNAAVVAELRQEELQKAHQSLHISLYMH